MTQAHTHPGRIATVTIGGVEIAQRDAAGNLLYTCCAHKARKCPPAKS